MLSTQPLQPGSSVGAENAPPSGILPHLRPEVQQRPPGGLQAKRRSCGAGTREWGTGRGVRWPGGSPGWTLLPPSPLGPSTGQGRRVGGWATCRAGGRVFQLAVRLLPFPSATASPRPVACAHHLFLAGRGLVLRARARLRWGQCRHVGTCHPLLQGATRQGHSDSSPGDGQRPPSLPCGCSVASSLHPLVCGRGGGTASPQVAVTGTHSVLPTALQGPVCLCTDQHGGPQVGGPARTCRGAPSRAVREN